MAWVIKFIVTLDGISAPNIGKLCSLDCISMAKVRRSSSMFDGTKVLISEQNVQLNWHLDNNKNWLS